MDSDEYDHGNDNCQNDAPAQLNTLFKISNTGCHRSTIYRSRFSTNYSCPPSRRFPSQSSQLFRFAYAKDLCLGSNRGASNRTPRSGIKTVTKRQNSDVSWRDSRGGIAVVCVFLIAITWFVFGQTVRHEFVNYDDDTYVYANPLISSGLTVPGVIHAFSGKHSGNWHPLTTLSHMLDCQLWGPHAGGHHFTNIVLHSIAVILLFLILRQMTGALWRSAFVAAVFAIHPLRVESVAWISERKDVLSAVFFILTLGAYIRYVRKPSVTSYLLVVLLFALGLMSKPMLVTVP